MHDGAAMAIARAMAIVMAHGSWLMVMAHGSWLMADGR